MIFGEDLYQHLLGEYSRMSAESTGPDWRDRAWWVLHPRWRPALWQLYSASARTAVLDFASGRELLLGIRVLCGTQYAHPQLTYDPQDCLPRRMTVRSLTWAELMAR